MGRLCRNCPQRFLVGPIYLCGFALEFLRTGRLRPPRWQRSATGSWLGARWWQRWRWVLRVARASSVAGCDWFNLGLRRVLGLLWLRRVWRLVWLLRLVGLLDWVLARFLWGGWPAVYHLPVAVVFKALALFW
jgi:hypothetical protein